MDSSDIAIVLKSMIEHGLMNNSYIFFIMFVFILFSSRKFLKPIKDAYEALFSKKDAEEIKTNIKTSSETMKESIKELSFSVEEVTKKIEDISKKVNENNEGFQNLKNDLSNIKLNLDKIYLEIARIHG